MERIAKEYQLRINSQDLAAMKSKDAKRVAIEEFQVLDEGTKREVLNWIRCWLRPCFKPQISAYWLKHQCEPELTRRYLSCTEMKGALLMSGYKSSRTNQIKWWFNVSMRSPLFTREAPQLQHDGALQYWKAFHEAVTEGKSDREAYDGAWLTAAGWRRGE